MKIISLILKLIKPHPEVYTGDIEVYTERY